jgi:hypothetical protein
VGQYRACPRVHQNLFNASLLRNPDIERVDETTVLDFQCAMRHVFGGRFDPCESDVLGLGL